MRLSIRHALSFRYDPAAKSVIGVLRLQPLDCESQHVTQWDISFDRDCAIQRREDCFGNRTLAFQADGPLESLEVVASGSVSTLDTSGVLRGNAERMQLEVYLRDSAATAPCALVQAFATAACAGAVTLLDKPHLLMRAVHEKVAANDSARRTPKETLEEGAGDVIARAHVFVAGARALGLPARIVTGYLWDDFKGKTQRGATQAHVWAEAFVEGVGWIGFDPLLCLCAHEGHVRMAVGVDHSVAEPFRAFPYGYAQQTAHTQIDVVEVKSSFGQSQSQG